MGNLGVNEFSLELSDFLRRLDCGQCLVRVDRLRAVLEQPWQQEGGGRDTFGDIYATAPNAHQQ